MSAFTVKEDRFLMDNYLNIPAKRMSKMLGRSESSARQRMKLLGIIVPAETIKKFKEESRFGKGKPSFNAGKKQSEYMSADAIERSKKSRFKSCHLPHNTRNDFEISIREDKRGVKYKFIRIALSKWIPLHRHNWIIVNGQIKRGLKLIFKDGDTMNCSLENLELLTAAELMKRNTYHNYPQPIPKLIQLRGALNRRINTCIKKHK